MTEPEQLSLGFTGFTASRVGRMEFEDPMPKRRRTRAIEKKFNAWAQVKPGTRVLVGTDDVEVRAPGIVMSRVFDPTEASGYYAVVTLDSGLPVTIRWLHHLRHAPSN